jgi:hypothetical protein
MGQRVRNFYNEIVLAWSYKDIAMLFLLWKGFFLWTAEGAEGAEEEMSEKGFAYKSKYILSNY